MSNILDTFYVLFKSNAKEVEQGEKEATEAGKHLEQQLGKNTDAGVHGAHDVSEANNRLAESFDTVREHGSEAFKHIIEQALEVAAAFQAIFAVEKLVDSVFETAEKSDQLGERARSMGIDVSELDAWGNATKRVGGSADAFGESLENVNRQLQRLDITGKSRALPFLKELGISAADAKKPIMELLPELAKATEGKSKQATAGALRAIGFDEGTIRLLQSGNKEIQELLERQKKLGLVTAEDAEVAEKFNREWDDITQIFHHLVVEADTYLLPTLESILDGLEAIIDFVSAHKNLLIGFFIGAAAAATALIGPLEIVDALFGWLLSPIVLVVAAIAALIAIFALAYEDILAFANGAPSLIGDLAKKWPLVGEAARGVIAAFKELRAATVEVIADIREWLGRIPEGFRQWTEIFTVVENAASAFGQKFVAIFSDMWNELFTDADGQLTPVGEALKGFFQSLGNTASEAMTAIRFSVQVAYQVVVALLRLMGAELMFLADLIVNPEHAFQNFGKRVAGIITDLVAKFPWLTQAFSDVGKMFNIIGDDIIGLWDRIGEAVSGAIGKVSRGIDSVRRFLHIGGAPAGEAGGSVPAFLAGQGGAALPDLSYAHAALAGTASPLAGMSGAAIAAGGQAGTVNHNSVVVGPTTIQAANDPAAIANAVDERMQHHVQTAIDSLADGVSH